MYQRDLLKMKSEMNEARFEYLKLEFSPAEECVSCNFKCDYRAPGDEASNQCPCEWALSSEDREFFKKCRKGFSHDET